MELTERELFFVFFGFVFFESACAPPRALRPGQSPILPIAKTGPVCNTRADPTGSSTFACESLWHQRSPGRLQHTCLCVFVASELTRQVPEPFPVCSLLVSLLLCIHWRSSGALSKFAKRSAKSLQHLVFPGGLPSKYWPGPTLLGFRDQTRSGVFRVVWP